MASFKISYLFHFTLPAVLTAFIYLFSHAQAMPLHTREAEQSSWVPLASSSSLLSFNTKEHLIKYQHQHEHGKLPYPLDLELIRTITLPFLPQGFADNLNNATDELYEYGTEALQKYGDVLFGVAIPVGLLACVAGYWLIKPFFFITGAGIGALVGGIIGYAATEGTSAVVWVTVTLSVLCAVIVGVLAVKLVWLGTFCIGAMLGVAISYAMMGTVFVKINPSNPHLVFYIVAAVLGLILGIFALWIQRTMLIVSTAFAGSFGFTYGIGHFAGHFPDVFSGNIPDYHDGWMWMYVVLFLLIGLGGIYIQFKYTAKKNRSDQITDTSFSQHDADMIPPEQISHSKRELLNQHL